MEGPNALAVAGDGTAAAAGSRNGQRSNTRPPTAQRFNALQQSVFCERIFLTGVTLISGQPTKQNRVYPLALVQREARAEPLCCFRSIAAHRTSDEHS